MTSRGKSLVFKVVVSWWCWHCCVGVDCWRPESPEATSAGFSCLRFVRLNRRSSSKRASCEPLTSSSQHCGTLRNVAFQKRDIRSLKEKILSWNVLAASCMMARRAIFIFLSCAAAVRPHPNKHQSHRTGLARQAKAVQGSTTGKLAESSLPRSTSYMAPLSSSPLQVWPQSSAAHGRRLLLPGAGGLPGGGLPGGGLPGGGVLPAGLPAGGAAALNRLPELPGAAGNAAPSANAAPAANGVLQAPPGALAAPAGTGGQLPASLLGPAVAKDIKV